MCSLKCWISNACDPVATRGVHCEEAEMRGEARKVKGLQPNHAMAAAQPHVACMSPAAACAFQSQSRSRIPEHFRITDCSDHIIGVDSAEDEIRS